MRDFSKNDVVFTKFGIGVIQGYYGNYTTDGVIVEIRGTNYYLALDDVDRARRFEWATGLRPVA